ncbi:AMP-binding protein, partial [Acetobacter senegalensis]|uniref:AMP-binding enzyme n=1 Tax=Acetobacter senegalensis TaxID=446692 RepID=UPI001EDA945F
GVARGYLGRPGLTAERFVPDPRNPGTRMYRSGDLGRPQTTDDIFYLGRNDFQVKIRGYRIEPGEIQAALLTHPDIREAAVIARSKASGDQYLAAYVVTDLPAEETTSILRDWLVARLPAYMVPAFIVSMETLPLTINGKLDRRALPEPELGSAEREIVAPRDDEELHLFTIWSEFFGNLNFGVKNGFIDIGGDSLTAMRIVATMNVQAPQQCMQDLLNNGSIVSQLQILGLQPDHSTELQGLQDFMQVLSGKDN